MEQSHCATHGEAPLAAASLEVRNAGKCANSAILLTNFLKLVKLNVK